MVWRIEYPYEDVERFVLNLQPTLAAKYFRLTDLMLEFGSNLGMPHTRAMSDGLFELRIKGQEGVARVFYCTLGRPTHRHAAWLCEEVSENPA